jgi:hypothetical protein
MAAPLLTTKHVVVDHDEDNAIIRIVRTGSVLESDREARNELVLLSRALPNLSRDKLRVLLDLRRIGEQDGSALQGSVSGLMMWAMSAGFLRVAVLVQTTRTKLAIQRFANRERYHSYVFVNEALALAFLYPAS